VNFVPYQQLSPDLRARYGLAEERLQGQMHLVRRDNSVVSGPVAIAEICGLLTPLGPVCHLLLRTDQAQRLYVWIARRRYRLFGCRNSCYFVR
jgi:predicted DCC family thiol-disulfide oxidoreductase YuxK